MDIGKRITFLRQQKNITVNKLANLAGVSQSYLRDLELGKKQPTVEYLSYVCSALNISLASFFSEDEEDDTIINTIGKLTCEQKRALHEFLKTIT